MTSALTGTFLGIAVTAPEGTAKTVAGFLALTGGVIVVALSLNDHFDRAAARREYEESQAKADQAQQPDAVLAGPGGP